MAKMYEVCSQCGCKEKCSLHDESYCKKCEDFEYQEPDLSEYYWDDVEWLMEEFGCNEE